MSFTDAPPESFALDSLNFLPLVRDSEPSEGQELCYSLQQTPKTIPPKYFYDQRGSELFEEICTLPEYYLTRTEAQILDQYSPDIAAITGRCELIELGSGSSSKTRFLLNAYQAGGNLCQYVPIDVSASALQTSVRQLQREYPSLSIQGFVGSYEQALAQLEPSTGLGRRMIFFLGSSLGNFAPPDCDRFLGDISDVLRVGDYFLLGIDRQKPASILEAAYNDSQGVTAAFNLNMLDHLNWRFQGNFVVESFSHQAIYNVKKHQIEMYLTTQIEQNIKLETLDLTIDLEAGEAILTEISRKFDLEQMQQQLATKNLETLQIYSDNQNYFGLILCQKRC
jgi:dimethylhistidine N-methyltransferase